METKLNCERCKTSAKDLQHFSCGHEICYPCTARLIFLNHMKDITNKVIVQIKCHCSAGSLDCSRDKMYEMLLNKVMKNPLCNNHKVCSRLYCTQCEAWLCDKCIDLHNGISQCHLMLDCQDNDLCEKHKKEQKKFFCNDCKEEVCKYCFLKGAKHFKHDCSEKLIPAITAQPQTIEEFSAHLVHIDVIASNLKKNISTGLASTVVMFDRIIQYFEIMKAFYIENVRIVQKETEFILKIIRMLYLIFYSDLKKSLSTLNVKLLEDLNSIQYSFFDAQFCELQVLERLKTLIEDTLNNETLFPSIDYKWNNVCYLKMKFKPNVILNGHTSSISSLVQLKDERIASASYDNTIKIWESKENSFKNSIILLGHTDAVRTLLLLKDEKLSSGSNDGTIKIWQITDNNFKNLITLTGHVSSVISMIQLSDGRIASGSCDNTIIIWELANNSFSLVHSLTGHNNWVYALLELRDERLVSGSADRSLIVWHKVGDNFQGTEPLIGHMSNIQTLLQLKDGRIASGSFDKTIRIWEEKEKTFMCSVILSGHSGSVFKLLQMSDGRVATSSCDLTIRIWEISENEYKSSLVLTGHTGTIYALVQLKDGRIASGGGDKTIRIWE